MITNVFLKHNLPRRGEGFNWFEVHPEEGTLGVYVEREYVAYDRAILIYFEDPVRMDFHSLRCWQYLHCGAYSG